MQCKGEIPQFRYATCTHEKLVSKDLEFFYYSRIIYIYIYRLRIISKNNSWINYQIFTWIYNTCNHLEILSIKTFLIWTKGLRITLVDYLAKLKNFCAERDKKFFISWAEFQFLFCRSNNWIVNHLANKFFLWAPIII